MLLRDIIFDLAPNVREKISYRLPFFYRRRWLCFIMPASHTKTIDQGVKLGLCNGNLLKAHEAYLEKADRKQVYYIHFETLQDMDEGLIKSVLIEAIEVDDSLSLRK